jgi:hypothetical protein
MLKKSQFRMCRLGDSYDLFWALIARTGTFASPSAYRNSGRMEEEDPMDGLIYLVGLIVIVMFILSALGLR